MPGKARSIVGQLLIKLKIKKEKTPTPPVQDPQQAENTLVGARQGLLERLNSLEEGINQLPFEPLKTPLTQPLTALREQVNTLDALPTTAAKAHRLMQVKEALPQLLARIEQAKLTGQTTQTAINTQTLALTTATNGLKTISVKAAKERLQNLLTPLQQQLTGFKTPTTLVDLEGPALLAPKITALNLDITQTAKRITDALKFQTDLSTTPLSNFKIALKGKQPATRGGLAPDVIVAEKKALAVQALIDTEQWSKVQAQAQKVKDACDAMTLRMDELEILEAMPEGDPKLLAKMQNAIARATLTKAKLSKHKDFNTAFKAVHDALDKSLGQVEWYADPINFPGANKTYASAWLSELQGDDRRARRSLDTYPEYDEVRQEVIPLITALENHAQSSTLVAEIKLLNAAKTKAHVDGPTQGWHCAKLALTNLKAQCAQLKKLADLLDRQATSVPVVTELITTKGLDPKHLSTAMKILAEEGCTPEEAVAMTETAITYQTEGMTEIDAALSARVKQSLIDSDPTLTPERAHAIGKQVRAKGTATGDDLKAVAQNMKRMPEGAVNALNTANVETIVCQGPVTSARPELHEVVPRGWGADQTWDEVPGLGGSTSLMVGTMDDGVGGRKVPGPNEGPCPHDTPDLLGHEAGHTIDTMGGGAKRKEVKFELARSLDLRLGQSGDDNGLRPIRDNYFMATAETLRINNGGTVTDVPQPERSRQTKDAALSETFAESFALHCQSNTTKWPELMKFWSTYTW